MEVWNTLRRQISTLWNQWSVPQRIGITAAAIACLAAVIGTVVWATQPEYVVLAGDLTPQRAAEIVGLLETEQIDVKLNFSGQAVSVSRSDVSRARLALKDVWDPPVNDSGSGFSGFPGSPAEEEDRRIRSLETRVARSVEQIRGIRSAIVHISRPDPSPFVIEQVPPTASVLVDPASRGAMTPAVGQSIVLMVARAVEGLTPENVTLTDTAGRQFSISDGLGGGMASQFEYQQRIELSLAQKAESMLARMLGEGKAVVRVTADIDFRETSRTETTYDPDNKVKRQENTETITQEGSGAIAAGVAGIDSQRVSDPVRNLDSSGSYKREYTDTEYSTASISQTVRDVPGQIRRLTVAAVVDLGTGEAGEGSADGNSPAAGGPAISAEQVEAIIKQAVGFDDTRSDEVQVVVAPLDHLELEPTAPGVVTFYEQYQPLIESMLVGLAATTAFLIAVLVLRRIRPVVVHDSSGNEFTRGDYQRMAALSEKAQHNPELAARIISAWLQAEGPSETPRREKPQPQSRAA